MQSHLFQKGAGVFQFNHELYLPAKHHRSSANGPLPGVPAGALPVRARQSPCVLPDLCTGWAARLFFLYGTAVGALPAECRHSRFQAARSGPGPAPLCCCMAREHHSGYRRSLQSHPLLPLLFPNGSGPRFPAAAKVAMFPVLAAEAGLRRLFHGVWSPQLCTRQWLGGSDLPDPQSCGQERSSPSHIAPTALLCPLSTALSHGKPSEQSHFNGKIRKLRVPDYLACFTACHHGFHVVCENLSRCSSKIPECVQHTALHAAQIAASYKFHVLNSGISQDHHENRYLVQLVLLVQILADPPIHLGLPAAMGLTPPYCRSRLRWPVWMNIRLYYTHPPSYPRARSRSSSTTQLKIPCAIHSSRYGL